MAVNFPDSPTNGDTTVINGATYTWDGVKWDTTSIADNILATYNSPSELPTTGLTNGDVAWVGGSTNKLYISNGTGWLSATLTNSAPVINSVQDASAGTTPFSLATDGTPTVITVDATDPEGFPLTYSYSVTSGALGTTATVSQADNVFTITPGTSDPADAGTFELTFSVTDGTNNAVSTATTFSLQFAPLERYAIDTTATSNAASLPLTQVNLTSPVGYTGGTVGRGVMFGDDGNKLYTLKYDSAVNNTCYIIQYDLPTAYDVTSTTTITPSVHTLTTQGNNPRGITMSKNGDYCYIANGANSMAAFQLSTPWEFSTATHLYDHFLDTNYQADIEISMDGTKVLFEIDGVFRTGTLSTPYDLRTSTTDPGTYDNSGFDNNPRSFQFDESGTKLTYLQNQTTLAVATFASSWTLTATPVSLVTYTLSGGGPGISEFDIGPDIMIGDSYNTSGYYVYTVGGITTE